MGCDIHAVAEARMGKLWVPIKLGVEFYWAGKELRKSLRNPGSTYEFYSIHDLGRNYTLFSLLAGVRGPEEPMKEPTGLPNDMYPDLYMALNDPDLHTPTWYEAQELIDLWDADGYIRYCNIVRGWGDEVGADRGKPAHPALIQIARDSCRMFPGGRIRFTICFDN
jgi:hypothetical protein